MRVFLFRIGLIVLVVCVVGFFVLFVEVVDVCVVWVWVGLDYICVVFDLSGLVSY